MKITAAYNQLILAMIGQGHPFDTISGLQNELNMSLGLFPDVPTVVGVLTSSDLVELDGSGSRKNYVLTGMGEAVLGQIDFEALNKAFKWETRRPKALNTLLQQFKSALRGLPTDFEAYIQAGYTPGTLAAMVESLAKSGLDKHAMVLAAFLKGESLPNPWTTGEVTVHFYPDPFAEPGDVWLDLADLTPHVYVPEPEDWDQSMRGWAPLYPVMGWQFRAFLNLVKYEVHEDPELGAPPKGVDLFGAEPLETQNLVEPVTEVYGDAAAAYAAWFQKSLLGDRLLSAREALSDELLLQLVPPGHRLWQFGGEELWLSLDLASADFEAEDFQFVQARGVYRRFETSGDTGFAVWVSQQGLKPVQAEQLVYPYVQLLNAAPRPVEE